jgi:LysM repeat protein
MMSIRGTQMGSYAREEIFGMKSAKLFCLVLVMVLAVASLPGAAAAAPLAQTNLLVNPGCEDGQYGDVAAIKNWDPWWETSGAKGAPNFNYTVKPHYAYEYSASAPQWVRSGNFACHVYNNWDPWHAGIRQTVAVPPGSRVQATAWGLAFVGPIDSTSRTVSESGVNANMQLGIDPNGNIDPFSSAVQWGGTQSPHGAYQLFTLEATAGPAGKITLFLSASYRGLSRGRLDSFWDDMNVTVITADAGQPTQSGPPPTNPPPVLPPFVMPTAGPDGNVVYVVQSGDSLWRIAANAGITVEQLKAMNGLTSNIVSIGQRLIIGQTTQAASTPTPQPTVDANAPTATTTPAVGAATATPAQVAAGVGTVCVSLYEDINGNGRNDGGEGWLAGGQLAIVKTGTGQPVQAYTTTGSEEKPYCFENLPAGQYTVSAAPPAGYNSTRANSTTLDVTTGSLSNMEFGAQQSSGGASENPAATPGDNRRLRTALFGAAGIMFLLLAAGVAGFLILRRR